MKSAPIVLAGGGPAAWKFCKTYREKGGERPLLCLCEEPLPPYNRVRLNTLFSGVDSDILFEDASWYGDMNIDVRVADPAVAMDTGARTVTTRSGRTFSYHALILATGSEVAIPPVEGVERARVLPYRRAGDVKRIREQVGAGQRATVLGGSLLGLEVAWELKRLGLHVRVVEQADAIMPHYMNKTVADAFARILRDLGVTISTSTRLQSIVETEDHRLDLHYEGGASESADILVLATGIVPRDDLARSAGLATGPRGGVLVDSLYRSSAPAVYAIGECACYQGHCFGLVEPVFEMAAQLADQLSGPSHAAAPESEVTRPTAVHLKLCDLPVSILGNAVPDDACGSIVYRDDARGIFKTVYFDKKTRAVVGAVLIGNVSCRQELHQLLGVPESTGTASVLLLPGGGPLPEGVEIPGDTILCHCEGIPYETVLRELKRTPSASYDGLKKQCGVAQCCGSCEADFLACYERSRPDAAVPGRWKLVLTKAIRSFHLFSSLTTALGLLFFALSGYMMNHRAEWGLDDVEEQALEKSIPMELLRPEAKDGLLSWLADQGARGHVSEFERDEETLYVEYKSARQTFDAEIDLATGNASMVIQKAPFLEGLAEIHRGLSPNGEGSSRFIDLMAALMGIVSISGIFLFFRTASRQNKFALGLFAAGLVLPVLVYLRMM